MQQLFGPALIKCRYYRIKNGAVMAMQGGGWYLYDIQKEVEGGGDEKNGTSDSISQIHAGAGMRCFHRMSCASIRPHLPRLSPLLTDS